MHSMYEGTLLQAELLSLSCSRDKLCVVEVVVVHVVQLYFVNALQKNKHPIPLNPFELDVASLFHSFAMLRRYWIHWTTFEALSMHPLMNCSFWWSSASDEFWWTPASDELASDDTSSLQERFVFRSTLTSGAVLFRCFLSFFFVFVYFFALLCSSRTY